MRLYDTKARDIVDIIPTEPGHLSLYACGPTVYRDAHVGNMRTFLLPDLIRRVAEDEGLQVKVVQNKREEQTVDGPYVLQQHELAVTRTTQTTGTQ